MEIEQTPIDEALLLRCFAGEATEAEHQQVADWVAASPANKDQMEAVYCLYFSSEMLNVAQQVSVPKALRRVKRRTHSTFKTFQLYFQRVAAILILPVSLLLSYVLLKDAFTEKTIEYVEMRTTPGTLSSINLPDGSKVWLNSNSYIKYPIRFTDEIREVQIEGEAYFAVAKDKAKRFVVETLADDVRIEVHGTEFNIDAYSESDFVATTLVSGAISLSSRNEQGQTTTLAMKPKQQIFYDREAKKAAFRSTNIRKDIAWKDNLIIFRNTPFDEALWILSKRFDVDFEIENKQLKKDAFTGTFNDQHLERILEHFRLSSDIHYRIEQPVDANGNVQRRKIYLM